MKKRITEEMLQKRLDILNDIFGYDREPYSYETPCEFKGIKGNQGTFWTDSPAKEVGTTVEHGYRLFQMSRAFGLDCRRNLSYGTARETYDIINVLIDVSKQMKRKLESE